MTEVVDYSYSRPSPADIVAGGYIGAMRYLGRDARCITRSERDALLAAGLGIGLCWETTADRVLGGGPAGRIDAVQANDYANQLDAPGGLPIYYATDFHASASQIAGPIADYYRAARDVGGRPVRVYGGAPVIDYMQQHLGLPAGWEAAATSWSEYRHSAHAVMLQRVGYVLHNSSDTNTVLCSDDNIDWLWGYEGGDIPVTPEELRAIINQECTNAINAALTMVYTGPRAVMVPDDPAVYEFTWKNGKRMRRHITTPDEVCMLQYADQVAGVAGDMPRMITDPGHVEAFKRLPLVGAKESRSVEDEDGVAMYGEVVEPVTYDD